MVTAARPDIAKVRKARLFALKLSRGELPTRQCSPYGGLGTDYATLNHEARAMYECLLAYERELS